MDIKRVGSQPSGKGPSEWFSGTVRIDPDCLDAPAPARVAGASVTFEPGARTAWHTHPLGQTLIVTSGSGRAQRWGGAVEEIRAGRCRVVPAGRKALARCIAHNGDDAHCHSRTLDGKAVDWMEDVTDGTVSGRSGTNPHS